MNRKKLFIHLFVFLCCFLLASAAPGDCQEKPKCAVLMLHADEASTDIYEFESRTLTTRFTEELIKFGKYDVMDTGEMVKILSSTSEGGEIKTCKLKGCAVRSGAALNVDYVIYGVFGHIGNMYSIETNLVEVKSGNLVQQVTTDYEGDRRGFAEKVPLENLKSLLGVSVLPAGAEIATIQTEEPVAAEESTTTKKFHFGPRLGIGASDDGVEFGGGLDFRYSHLSLSALGNDAGVTAGLAYFLHAEGNSPYLSAVFVYYDTENHGLDEIGRIWGGLLGYRIMLGHGLDLNLGVGAGYVNWDQTESPDFGNRENDEEVIPIGEITLGYSFGFMDSKPKPSPAPVPPRADSDKDGVFDSDDACPNTPIGVTVDAKGCPLDSDKDGVFDSDDACPNTPIGVTVDAKGCPLDSDKDGVTDDIDKCPNTPTGARVDARGCWVIPGVLFDTNQSTINTEHSDMLDEVVKIMNDNPDHTFLIEGHTDNVGSAAYNQKLSEKRANSVKNYLVTKGISSDRLTTSGLGFDYPIASNDTEEGRALNRRVEIKRSNLLNNE